MTSQHEISKTNSCKYNLTSVNNNTVKIINYSFVSGLLFMSLQYRVQNSRSDHDSLSAIMNEQNERWWWPTYNEHNSYTIRLSEILYIYLRNFYLHTFAKFPIWQLCFENEGHDIFLQGWHSYRQKHRSYKTKRNIPNKGLFFIVRHQNKYIYMYGYGI